MFSRTLLVALMTLPTFAADPVTGTNPFFTEWTTPFGVPPFASIQEEHFLPALKEGMARQKREVAAITASKEAPTFQNTVVALEQTGQFSDRVMSVFSNLVGAETT
ncbi:MAG: hypothetical protein WCO20_07685, partial [Holophagaceae bacterium]